MAKTELGTKRVCPDTGRKFYDLNKTPVVSPYTGKIVPIAAAPVSRSRPEPVAPVRPPVPEEVEVASEAAEAEFVSLEDAEAEQQGKKKPAAAGAGAGAEAEAAEDEDVEIDESLDDAAFIEEEEEGSDDVTDIIGESIEKEEES